MGGAFIGFADDVTAAYSNPAGLTNLTVGGPEVALETRFWNYSPLYLERGHIGDTQPFGVGIDTVAGVQSEEASSKVAGLSFLSLGYVLPRGFTIALYRHQLADYRINSVSQGFFQISDPEVNPCGEVLPASFEDNAISPVFNTCRPSPPSRTATDLRIANTGLSAAYQLQLKDDKKNRQSLSVGLGLSYYQMEFSDKLDALYFYPYTGNAAFDRLPRGFVGPADTLDDNVAWTGRRTGNENTFGINVGLLYHLEPHWSIGAVFREGPDFRAAEEFVTGPAYERFFRIPRDLVFGQSSTSVTVPDFYGIGVAYSASEGKTKIALDYDLVRYSQRLRELVAPLSVSDFKLADGPEIHLGWEQVVLSGGQFTGTLRLGVWHEASHEPRYVGGDSRFKTLFPGGKSELHWAGGVGIVIREDYQIDASLERSDRIDTVSVSLVRFF